MIWVLGTRMGMGMGIMSHFEDRGAVQIMHLLVLLVLRVLVELEV
jgi:hypothetical protein